MTLLDVGELLVRRGMIAREQLQHALEVQRKVGGALPATIAQLGYIGEEKLVGFLSQALSIPAVKAEALEEVPRDVVAHLTRELAERYRGMPLQLSGFELKVCVSDPDRLDELEELGRLIGRSIVPVLVSESVLSAALDRYYGVRPELGFSRAPENAQTSNWQMKAVGRDVERTGITRVPTGLTAAVMAPPADVVGDVTEQLAAANIGRDLVWPMFRFFAEMFPEVAVLGLHKGRVQLLMTGNRLGVRRLASAVEVPLMQESLIWSVLVRPQVCYRAAVDDAMLANLVRAAQMPATDVALVPVFDQGRPVFLVVAQGRTEQQIHAAFEGIKAFLTKVAKALRIVALKIELRGA